MWVDKRKDPVKARDLGIPFNGAPGPENAITAFGSFKVKRLRGTVVAPTNKVNICRLSVILEE